MALILLLVGIALFTRQRVDYGSLRAAGRHVRVAGALLMLPALFSLLMNGLFLPLAFGRNESAIDFARGLVGLLELAGMVLVAALAWALVARPANLPRLPGLLGKLQDEARAVGPAETPAETRQPAVNLPRPGGNPIRRRETYPSVMSLPEAARYMEVSEEAILQWIEEGRLAASRENWHYRIARSQLDELR